MARKPKKRARPRKKPARARRAGGREQSGSESVDIPVRPDRPGGPGIMRMPGTPPTAPGYTHTTTHGAYSTPKVNPSRTDLVRASEIDCPVVPVEAKTWEKPECPEGFVLYQEEGDRFEWVVEEDERTELWYDTIYGDRGYIFEEMRDLRTNLNYWPEWISNLQNIRSSIFDVNYRIVVQIFPTQRGMMSGPPQIFEFECDYTLTRPFWRYDLYQEGIDHLIATLQWISEWNQQEFGGSPVLYFVYLIRWRTDQYVQECRPKPKRKRKPAPKKRPKPAKRKPALRKERIEYTSKTGKKRKQVVYRDAKGRFARKPIRKRPIRKRKKG